MPNPAPMVFYGFLMAPTTLCPHLEVAVATMLQRQVFLERETGLHFQQQRYYGQIVKGLDCIPR